MTEGGRRGRRPGKADTRGEILDAARQLFAERGYAGASVRAIAGAAGVDPALVHHYFGTKERLFLASVELPVDPREVLAPAIALGPDGMGERLVRAFVTAWDDPDTGPQLVAFAISLMDPSGRELVAHGILPVLILPLGKAIGITEPDRRMTLVASQILGLILVRYVLALEPVASMSADQVVAIYGPTVQRYLTGDLGPASA